MADADFEEANDTDESVCDNEDYLNLEDDLPPKWSTRKYMPDSSPSEEDLSTDDQTRMTKQFADVFAERHSSEAIFFQGSLEEAIEMSCHNPFNPRPLILYICNGQSIADNVFCGNYLRAGKIVEFLNEQFVVWPWDISYKNNQYHFLRLLIKQFGSELSQNIASGTRWDHQYPVLVCLYIAKGRFHIERTISSDVKTEAMLYAHICTARNEFESRNNPENLSVNNDWFIPDSCLTEVTGVNGEIQRSLTDLQLHKESVAYIKQIESIVWSIRYSTKRKQINDRIGHSRNERILFYGCSLSVVSYILEHGFPVSSNQKHGKQYGGGFLLSSDLKTCQKHSFNHIKTDDKATLICCRVLVGKCRTDGSEQESPTEQYDSTGNGTSDFVVTSNEQILPQYLIVYK